MPPMLVISHLAQLHVFTSRETGQRHFTTITGFAATSMSPARSHKETFLPRHACFAQESGNPVTHRLVTD